MSLLTEILVTPWTFFAVNAVFLLIGILIGRAIEASHRRHLGAHSPVRRNW